MQDITRELRNNSCGQLRSYILTKMDEGRETAVFGQAKLVRIGSKPQQKLSRSCKPVLNSPRKRSPTTHIGHVDHICKLPRCEGTEITSHRVVIGVDFEKQFVQLGEASTRIMLMSFGEAWLCI
jgi:hypothetical protein